MAEGLSLDREASNDKGSVTVNVNGTLALGKESEESIQHLTVNMKNGSTLAAWCGEDGSATGEVTVKTTLSVEINAALALSAGRGQELVVHSDLSKAGSLAVKGGGKVSLNDQKTLCKVTLQSGTTLSLANGALTIADKAAPAARLRSRAAQVDNTMENVTLTANSMAGQGDDAVLRGAAVTINESSSFSVSDLVLDSSDIVVASTSLSLEDVMLASGSTVAGQSTAIEMQNVTLALNADTYTLVEDGSAYGEAYSGRKVAVYYVNNFRDVTLSGDLLMDLSALPATVAASGNAYDFIAFDFGSVDCEGLTLSAGFGTDGAPVQGYQVGSTSAYLFAAPAGAVPEPTTAALSLLGLGALALRRRRR